jgi:DNA ligase-1
MLCKSEGCLNDMIDVLKKSKNEYLAETKYDGERTQVIYRIIYRKIHYNGNNVKMYSRNFEDQLTYYPALGNILENDIIKNDKDVHNFIVDGEICCFSKSTKKFSNFQELRRKVDDTDKDYFIILFDILYMNNHDLSKENIEIRKLNLVKFFSAISKKILVERGTKINFHSNKAVEKIQDLFNKARLVNCEGLVLKETGEKSKYNYGKRQWYKVKSLDEKNCETLDLVPIAGFNGTGKNSNRLSSFVMASYDMQNNRFIAICKLGIGFTEENLDLITKNLMKSALSKPSPNYDIPKNLKPNILFKPTEIWEVGFDSFSVSINYSLGRGLIHETNDSSGLSLRFPRFCRFRPDKKLENSNTPEEIISLFMKFKNYSL